MQGNHQSKHQQFSPPPSSSPQGISLYLANAKKAREIFGRNSSSSPNPLFNHLLPQTQDDSLSLSVLPDSPVAAEDGGKEDGDSSEIEYVDESLVISGKNRNAAKELEEDGGEDQEEEQQEDKENHPSQLSMRPTTPSARRLAKDDQPHHSTPIPPQHSTPIAVGGIKPQRTAGPRSALRPLELEGVSLSTRSKPNKSFLDEALDMSSQSGGEGQSSNNDQAPASSQRQRQTIAQIRTAAHAREQAQMAVDQREGGYWGEEGMNGDEMDQDDDDGEMEGEDEEDPFGFFTSLKTRKRKSDQDESEEREGKKAHTSNDEDVIGDDKPTSSPNSNLDLDENLDLEGGRNSSKTSNTTHQVKYAEAPMSPPSATDKQEALRSSNSSTPESLLSAKAIINKASTKEKSTDKARQTKTPSSSHQSASPSTSQLGNDSNLNSQSSSQQSDRDQIPSSPVFDVVLPPRDGKKSRANAATTSAKPKSKASAAKTRGKGKGKGKKSEKEDQGDQSRLKIDDLVGLLPGRRGRTVDSLSPPPGSRESRSKAKSKPTTKNAKKATASKKKPSKKQESSDDEDDIFSSSEKDKDEEMDESWIGKAGKRIPLKNKSTNPVSKSKNNNTTKKTASSSTNKKVSSTTTSKAKKPLASSKKNPQVSKSPTRSSKRGKKEDVRVMVIIENSDGESDTEEEEEGSSDDDNDTSKENVGASKKKPAAVQNSKVRLVDVVVSFASLNVMDAVLI